MTLEEVQIEVSQHLDDIKRMFKPSTRALLLVSPRQDDPEGKQDFVMGDMKSPLATAMIERAKARGL